MLRLILILSLLSSQEDDLRALVRRLGDDDVSARDRAGRALELRGTASMDALAKALEDPDLEIRSRANVLLDRIDPSYFLSSRILVQRERKLRQLALPGPPRAKMASTDGAEFHFERRRWIEGGKTVGSVLRTYAYKQLDGDLEWSPTSVRSTRDLRIETCSTHSPALIFIRGEETEPLTLVLKGTRRWLCDVPIHFSAPKEGATRRIGKFTVTLEWPQLVLRCDDPLPPSLVTLMLRDQDVQARTTTSPVPDVAWAIDEPAIFFPEVLDRKKNATAAWCGCDRQPTRSDLRPETSQKRGVRIDGNDVRGTHELASVSLVLHVPVEEPFEVTSPPLK